MQQKSSIWFINWKFLPDILGNLILESRQRVVDLRITKIMNIPIETIKEYFSTQPVKRVYLFGSTARNEANYQIDIDDLLVGLDI